MKNERLFVIKMKHIYNLIFLKIIYKIILLFFISLCCANTWVLQESHTKNHLKSIHLNNKNEGWIVGEKGTVLVTKNGGDDWNKVDLATENNLNYITFVTPDTGWIVGNSGTIFVTYNKGINWEKFPINHNGNFKSIYFLNSEIGWLTYGGLLKTIDGGKNWTEINSEAFTYYIGTTYSISQSSILFLDSLCGFVSGNYSYTMGGDYNRLTSTAITNDAGKTWFKKPKAGGSAIYFIDSTTIITADDGWSDNFGDITISKSIDKGNTWQRLYYKNSFSKEWPYGIQRTKKYVLYMKFFNDSQGIILSTHQKYYTEDKGNSWRTEKYLNDLEISNGFFVSKETGWVIGSNGMIYKTTQNTIRIEKINKFEKNSHQIIFKLLLNNNNDNPIVKFIFNQRMTGTFKAYIFNTLGVKIESVQYNENSYHAHAFLFPLPDLPAGPYFLVVNCKDQIKSNKFCIVK